MLPVGHNTVAKKLLQTRLVYAKAISYFGLRFQQLSVT